MGLGKQWTPEEETYLAENWGRVTIDGISRHLNRSKNAIMIRVNRLGLPPYFESGEYITVNALHNAFYGNNFSTYQLKSWVKDRGFPVHNKRRGNYVAKVVYLDEFWEWAEKNRSFLDFSKMEPLALGKEPAWVQQQRSKDFISCSLQRKDPWTPGEDDKLRGLLKFHSYGYAELAQILHRSEGAIMRRCNDLKLQERPVRKDPHDSPWTASMLETVGKMIRNGDSYAQIGRAVGKSEKAVRGKVYNVYLTENADKVRAMMGGQPFGSGAPVPTVRQGFNLASCRKEVRKNLSILDGILRFRMNELGWDPYFQRHMCLNWDDMKGCAAGCDNCDDCAAFRRIPPQYCARCGATFFEREENRFCPGCRTARKKKAQRHWARTNGRRQQ